jgi:1-acyl-sn-glycerol-3-phosphate acyltransferase
MQRKLTFMLVSTPLGLLKEFLLKTRRIVLVHLDYLLMLIKRKIRDNISFMILSNHPSLWETIIFVLLLWPKLIFYPSLIPVSTPDETNFIKGKLFGYLSFFVRWIMSSVPSVAIPRRTRDPKKIRGAISEMTRKLEKIKGRIMIIFGEGGRTGRETNPENLIYSENKERSIRKFQKGVVRIIRESKKDFYILPTYIVGAEKILPMEAKIPRLWRRMKIYFGRPLNTKNLREKSDAEILKVLQQAVLNA